MFRIEVILYISVFSRFPDLSMKVGEVGGGVVQYAKLNHCYLTLLGSTIEDVAFFIVFDKKIFGAS